jgi:hypothetical protein
MNPLFSEERGRQIFLTCLTTLTILISATAGRASSGNGSPLDWKLLADKNGIRVSYIIEECSGGQRVLFQIQNQTSEDVVVDVECKVRTRLNGKLKNIFIPSLKNAVAARSTISGTCADKPFQSTFILLPKESAFEAIQLTLK